MFCSTRENLTHFSDNFFFVGTFRLTMSMSIGRIYTKNYYLILIFERDFEYLNYLIKYSRNKFKNVKEPFIKEWQNQLTIKI